MRVFLDSNVLVSAFTTRGLCADVLRVVLRDHTLLTGEFNLRELCRVLERVLTHRHTSSMRRNRYCASRS